MTWAALEEAADRYHLVLLIPLVSALIAGPLLTRWLRRSARRRGAAVGEAIERAASGSIRLLVILIGLGWALSLLPHDPRWAAVAEGVLYVLTVLVAARLVMRLVSALVHAYLDNAAGPLRERAQKDYLPLATSITTVTVALIATIVIARHFGHDVSSLVTALGIGSLAIGLAAQQTLGNMIAGFTLLVDRPFRPGDRIRLQTGEVGQVSEIGIRSTRILLDDENVLIAPNAELANSRVVNFYYPSSRGRGEVRLKVGARSDLDGLIAYAVEQARAQPGVLAEPAPEAVLVGALDETGELAVRFHVGDQSQLRTVEERLRRLLWSRRNAAG